MSAAYPAFTVRRAAWADVPELVRQRRGMFAAMQEGDDSEMAAMERAFTDYLASAMPASSFNAWLAHAPDGEVLGGGAVVVNPWPPSPLRLMPRRAYILNVYVYPDHRRRGVARALMQAMLEWCRAERFTAVQLHASADGRALYEQLGFTPTNEMRLEIR